MRTTRIALVTVTLVLSWTLAAGAGPLTGSTKSLGSGQTAVRPCGALGGATVSLNARNSTLIGLTVANLPGACNGARLSIAATNAVGIDLGHGGPVTIVGGSATLGLLSALPAIVNVKQFRLVVSGP